MIICLDNFNDSNDLRYNMEHYKFNFDSNSSSKKRKPYTVAGVVASGNLEILVEDNKNNTETTSFDIKTSTEGYEEIWKSVISDIVNEYEIGGLNFSINDGGAVPAIVSLRLRQAIEEIFE